MPNVFVSIWDRLYGSIDLMHTLGLILLASLIPFFSIVAIRSIRVTTTERKNAILDTFPQLKNTTFYKAFIGTESKVAVKRFLLPLLFLFCLNGLLSIVVLDGTTMSPHDGSIVILLCGGHCADSGVAAYQTQTLVIASYAFIGWMVWTLTAIYDRAAVQQLYPATLYRLLVRLVVAVLVAVVIRHFAADSTKAIPIAGPTPAFVVGMFPEWAVRLISSKFENLGRSSRHSEDFDLELIEGIGPSTAYRLPELSIEDGSDLAHANPFTIFDAVAIPMSEATDWIGQAQLLLLLKADRTQTLQKAGYRTIFDLVRLLKSKNGRAAVQTLCNWVIPEGYDQAAAIESDGAYQRLREVRAVDFR